MNRIRSIFRSGGSYTKQNIAEAVGLSIATCSNFLNELEAAGEIAGQKQQTLEVGRATMVYELNADYHLIACIAVKADRNAQTVQCRIKNLLSRTVWEEEALLEQPDYEQIEAFITALLERCPGIHCISLSIPGTVERGVIRQCDIKSLIGEPLVEKLERNTGLPVYAACDMHLSIYGYYKKECEEHQSVSMLHFPEGVLPGAGSLVCGCPIEGANHFAGMIAYLPYGISLEEQLKKCRKKEYIGLAAQAAASVIALINPDLILLTGDLVEPEDISCLYGACLEWVPEENIPELIHVEAPESYLYEGLYMRGLEKLMEGE